MLSPQRCQYCHEPLVGRVDKKFCGDQCRSAFNNRNRRPQEKAMIKLNEQLRKNRTILKTLCPTGKATVRKEVLDGIGFSFRHFTSLFGQYPKTYFLCYDYAYLPLIEKSSESHQPIRKVLIVQHQPYMKRFDPWSYLKD